MGHGLDVFVRNGYGKPMVGVGVEVAIDADICGGSMHSSTDGEGYAHFKTADWIEDHCELTYECGRWFGPFKFDDGVYTIHLQ